MKEIKGANFDMEAIEKEIENTNGSDECIGNIFLDECIGNIFL